jgi:putative nucleotidyltransferase with HDIG domain
MLDLVKSSSEVFEEYVNSFSGLSPGQQKNFDIKREHSLRVAENSLKLAQALKMEEQDRKTTFLAGMFHDTGRFSQLITYNTFNDAVSVDHASLSVEILREEGFLDMWTDKPSQDIIFYAIEHHNKLALPSKAEENQLLHARLLRDADKLDILKVITDYYTNKNQEPNHTLTWELPKANSVSPGVTKAVLSGKLVSKNEVKSELDVKIMQLSWIYDINFKASVEIILNNRYMEKIYSSLPKNDTVIDIYRKIKIFANNKLFE